MNRLEYEEAFNRQQPPQNHLHKMNSPIRQPDPQSIVQQQHTPQQMQQNFRTPHRRENTKPFPPQMQNRNVPNYQQYPNQQFPNKSQENPAQMRYPQHQLGFHQKSNPVARPHSADFLEFERRHPLDANTNTNMEILSNESGGFRTQNASATPNRYAKHRGQGTGTISNPQPPRPKSSFEHRSPKMSQDGTGYHDDNNINDVAMELSNYDWSEEAYAEKMRMQSQSRSRSQSRASQAYNYSGMEAGNSNMPQYPSNYNQNTSQMPNEVLQVNLKSCGVAELIFGSKLHINVKRFRTYLFSQYFHILCSTIKDSTNIIT